MSYGRIVCGVDGSREAIEAARQAARLADSTATARLVMAIQPWDALWDAGPGRQLETARGLERQADQFLAAAQHGVDWQGRVETVKKEGGTWEVLLAEVADDAECLLALGPPRQGRTTGMVAGDAVVHLLRKAPCSVLVARQRADPEAFPGLVVAGIDGSPESDAAFAVAWELHERYASEIRPVVARGGKGIDLEAVQQIVRGVPFKVDKAAPADALGSASHGADLVVVGSRGLHGARAIGSVSERVAHKAACSVLVVRGVRAGDA